MKRIAAVVAGILLFGCSDPTSTDVSAASYGDRWPLNVEKATLRCLDGSRTLEVDGMAYALNGKALRAGLPRPDAVLKNPAEPNLAELTEKAGTLCAK